MLKFIADGLAQLGNGLRSLVGALSAPEYVEPKKRTVYTLRDGDKEVESIEHRPSSEWSSTTTTRTYTTTVRGKRTVRELTPEEAKAFDAGFAKMDRAFDKMDEAFGDFDKAMKGVFTEHGDK